MLTGEPPSPDSSADFFAAAPDGKAPEDMLKLGVFGHAGKLIGLLDIARDHPAPGTWYLGLLLIDCTRSGPRGSRSTWREGRGRAQRREPPDVIGRCGE